VTVESRQVLVRDEVGQPVAILEINRDITGRKQREQENQEQYRTIVRTANEGIWLVDTQAQTVYINERMASMLGYTATEMAGRSFPEFIFPEDQSSTHERIESNLQGNFEQFDFRFRRKDGSSLYTLASTNPVRDGRGGIVGALGMYTDLTERKQAEEALLTSEEQLRLALEAGKIGVWDWDVQHDTLTWSERVYELHGVSKDSFTVTVENFISLVHPEDKAWVQEAIEKALTANAPFNIDLRIVTPQGVTRWLTTSASVTYDKAGKPIRMLGATSDITEQKELEQRKDEFIGMASHELKTPITTLKARTQLLKRRLEKQGLSEAVQALAKMEMQIDRLTRLVADLLDISKIQAGRLDYAEERIALDAFLYDIVETAQQMSATHTLCIHGASDAYVIGDSDRLEQVFLNLISNAIKYSPLADKVDIHIETTRDTVTVKVQDYGVGIPTEHQSKIFDRFYRAYDEKNKTFPGLGMGLYISAEIVKRHGGEISVDSMEGEGTIFAVSLPVAPAC
jgi:PAS domain S-box-containing protein